MKRKTKQLIKINLVALAIVLPLELYAGGWHPLRREVRRWEVSNSAYQARLIEYEVIGLRSDRRVQTVEVARTYTGEWREVASRPLGAGFPIRPALFWLSSGRPNRLYVDEDEYETADGGRSWVRRR